MHTVPLPIAIVQTAFHPGGTERQMIELAARLDPSRWTVHVACFHREGAWLERAAQAAASIEEFPVRGFRSRNALWQGHRFVRWCRARRIAIVHASDLYANIFALPAAAAARVPVRIGNRREINPDKTLSQIGLQRAGYFFATRIVANSQAAAARLRAEFVPTAKISVVSSGLAFETIQEAPARPIRRRVMTVANLRPEKAHDVLIAAAPRVLAAFPDASFQIVGDGPERQRLVERADAAGVGGAFSFRGHLDDVPRRLQEADLFVLPSRSEAFPNAVLEAMAAGLPVVATAVGGIVELVEPGRTGELVPADDPAALAERICHLMAQPDEAARLGRAARAHVLKHYSFERMVAAMDRIYAEQIAARGRRIARAPQLAAS